MTRARLVTLVATASIVLFVGVLLAFLASGGGSDGARPGDDGQGGTGQSGSGQGGTGPQHAAVPAEATPAVIEYVHDGDTLFLDDDTKVRLLGVDTPEVGEHAECYGDEATALLRSLLPEDSTVSVLSDVQPLDQYGRALLLLWTADGTFVNLELIERGAAEAVVLEPNLLYADEFEAAEDAAKAAGLGLWGACR